jgi:hypothetical protein
MPFSLRSGLLLLLLVDLSSAQAATKTGSLGSPTLFSTAREVEPGGELGIEGVRGLAGDDTSGLVLHRFEAIRPDLRIVIHSAAGVTEQQAPDNRYFRGAIEGMPGSQALLSVLATGQIRGLLSSAGRFWVVDTASTGALVTLVSAEALRPRPDWRCGADQLRNPPAPEAATQSTKARRSDAIAATYTASVAVETDYEFFSLFGDTTQETNYILDLFAYSSSIYQAQVDTSLLVGYLSLWTTPADPWSAGDSGSELDEFSSYWQANHGDVTRTTAHFLSARNLGGGIAYLNALCSGFGYGVSGNLEGSFNPQNPSIVWDIEVVSHEIGHNFGSPHTHCYGGIGGDPNPVDMCYGQEGGCYAGPAMLPGPPGVGSGTIMSYCHLLNPGLTNISLTFGTGHPYGDEPDRVPTVMHDYVVQVAQFDPACLLAGPAPSVSIGDAAAVVEGNSGLSNAHFTVSLDHLSGVDVSVSYATADGTATGGSDYVPKSGTLTIPAGGSSAGVDVSLIGDLLIEPDETFFVNLSNPTGATIADGQGQSVILNDDFPAISVSDAAVVEGDSGSTNATFTATLSVAGPAPVTVDYATADGTATAGSDYTATIGTLTFAPGTTSLPVNVAVLGDVAVEPDETFLLNLTNATNATLADPQGIGYIADDDAVSLSKNELIHGSDQAGNLGSAGPAYYRISQAPRSSYEVLVDGTSGAVAPVVLDRLAADGTTVLQTAATGSGGAVASLRWLNPSPGAVLGESLRVEGACGGSCLPTDTFRIRAWDTTARISRFNNSATQITVLVVQNTGSETLNGTISYWDGGGTLLAAQAFSVGAHSTFVANTSAVVGLAGHSGSITLAHDGRHGTLAGKAVAIEPATGFTFDTPLTLRER